MLTIAERLIFDCLPISARQEAEDENYMMRNKKFNKAISTLTRYGYKVLSVASDSINVLIGSATIEAVSVSSVWRCQYKRIERILND